MRSAGSGRERPVIDTQLLVCICQREARFPSLMMYALTAASHDCSTSCADSGTKNERGRPLLSIQVAASRATKVSSGSIDHCKVHPGDGKYFGDIGDIGGGQHGALNRCGGDIGKQCISRG